MIERISKEPQWALNAILSVLVVMFGILTAIIGYNVSQMDDRINSKADKEVVAAMCERLELKADKDYLNRVDSGLQVQLGNLTSAIEGLRSDLRELSTR